jgi:hypothetical protein
MNAHKVLGLAQDLPPEAAAVYHAANAALVARFEANQRRRSTASASIIAGATPTVPQPARVENADNDAKPVDIKSEWFSKLTLREQCKELYRIIGLRRLDLDDDRVAEIFASVRTQHGR